MIRFYQIIDRMYTKRENIMKKIKILTPENIELEVVLAEVLSRSIAAFIDFFIQCILILLIGWEYLALINQLFIQGMPEYYGWLLGGMIIIEFIIVYGYYMISEILMCGRTLGKKVMHLRIIRNNGGPVTIKHVVIRNLFRVFIDNFGIGILMMFFNKKNKRLGDIVAGTIVVIEENQERPIALEKRISLSDEVRGYLSDEEYALLREYFNRKATMTHYELLRIEMKQYFQDKFIELGIYENNRDFIEAL